MTSAAPLRLPGLEGKTAVVTGAARGQGAATALVLAASGAHVIATDLGDIAEELLLEIPVDGGFSSSIGTKDMSDQIPRGTL